MAGVEQPRKLNRSPHAHPDVTKSDLSVDSKSQKSKAGWSLKPTKINHFTGKPLRGSTEQMRYNQTKQAIQDAQRNEFVLDSGIVIQQVDCSGFHQEGEGKALRASQS